jgi:hypothetical protein
MAINKYQWQDTIAPLKVRVAPSAYTPAQLREITAQKNREKQAQKTGTWNNGNTN